MKTTQRILAALFVLVLGIYSIITTVRIRQLEARLSQPRFEHQPRPEITYAFDDSFIQYFGKEGMAAVNEAWRRDSTLPQFVPRAGHQDVGLRFDVR